MTDEEKIIWCAGYFEGSGRIQVSKSGKSQARNIFITIHGPSEMSLRNFRHNIGGGTVVPNRALAGNRNQLYRWQQSGAGSGEILQKILPWLVTKYDQAVLGIELASTIDSSRRPVSPEVVARREEIEHELRVLRVNSKEKIEAMFSDSERTLDRRAGKRK